MIIHDAICEKILVSLRGVLAHRLSRQGLSQHRISSLLHVSQPMVNKLLKKPMEEYLRQLHEVGLEREVVEYYVEILCSLAFRAPRDRFELASYQVVNTLALKAVCSKYKEIFTSCSEGLPVDPDVEYYRVALLRITSIEGLHRVIPEVGSNLVYAPRPPASVYEIIGLTGRITRTLNGVAVTGEPMYGGSRHLSRLLLTVSTLNPAKRVGFNTRYEEVYVEALRDLGLKLAVSGPHEDVEGFWKRVEMAAREKPDAIADLGGKGLEPVVYIFTTDFNELERILVSLVKRNP
ncbi:thiamine-phosphate synthase family protein [Desulfurococcus mucosus]|uniref:Phosphomethylpyrimidine kinase n=1 Tax=Desulfurococcus mucosus (strain ATCC 35584 / DSM 2162 / JCM 9187 / O7/1) TaxID=765177 RepID=E8R979_DESM0|nr:thiamine-phosphate synthase family protein [Desulfurococcus mucosus]ADV65055.1 Phosphomethylpyrimidine kinase [Desulfurococcus mucosus DSM 2162]